MEIEIKAKINARNMEEVGEAMGQMYGKIREAMKANNVLPLPGVEPPRVKIEHSYEPENTREDSPAPANAVTSTPGKGSLTIKNVSGPIEIHNWSTSVWPDRPDTQESHPPI